MEPISIVNQPTNELLDAQTHIWNHIFSFLHSMALKCAIELGIPNAIQKHGKPTTLSELAKSLSIHPQKVSSLARLMHLLVHSNFFCMKKLLSGEETFDLTINSQLLLEDHPLTLAPFALMALDPNLVKPSYHFSYWFQNEEETPFHIAHNNKNFWEYGACVPKFKDIFHEGIASDTKFISSLLVASHVFRGLVDKLESLVDVGGGNGTMAKELAKAFPRLSCIVLDLPHAVKGLKECQNNVTYIGGDMFENIPSAQAVLLKSILHDWSNEKCIKILQKCKKAIPSREQGGKVIIIDMVVEANNDTQLLFDMEMMNLTNGGRERKEKEWKQLFLSSGFNNYNIYPILGLRSIIEVFPS
ncbi:unnamed protein product [Amaranthus hypochondriacus]